MQVIPRFAARGLLAASLLAGLFASTALAIDNPLDAVPEDAVAVVRFKKPTTTVDNAVKLVAAIDRTKSPKLKQMSNDLGAMIYNPKGTGVDLKQDWYVVYIAPPAAGNTTSNAAGPLGGAGAGPGAGMSSNLLGTGLLANTIPVYAIAASKMDTMEAAVKQGMQNARMFKHDNWLFYSDSDTAINRIQECKSGRVKSIRDTIDAQSKGVMDATDLSIYFNVRSLTRGRFKTELEAIRIELEEAIKNPGSLAPLSVNSVDLKPVYEGYSELLHGVWQAVNDCESITVGATVKPARGVDVEVYTRVETGSPTADAFKSTTSSSMALLEKMPQGSLGYFASHGSYESMTRWSLTMARTFTQDEQIRKTIDEVLAGYGDVQHGTTVTAFSLGDASSPLRYTKVSEVKPIDKARSLARKMTGLTSGLAGQTTQVKEEAETIADQKVDVIESKSPDAANASGIQAEILKSLGGGGTVTRIAYLTDLIVETEGGGPEAMEAALSALGVGKKAAAPVDQAAARNSLAGTVRTQLSPNANFVMLLDLGGIVAEGVKQMGPLLGGLMNLSGDQTKKLSVKRSYLGLSLSVEPTGARVKMHVPNAQITSLVKLGDVFAPLVPLLTPAGGAGPGRPAGAL